MTVGFQVAPLTPDTWPAFASLVERHNGVWGGCWCMGFHPEGVGRDRTAAQNREAKQRRVAAGKAHAALVFEAGSCIGWCQYGSLQELPRIKHRRAHEAAGATPADWRITCFFVDRARRHSGVADTALAGALGQIGACGGGLVESFPEEAASRTVSSSFLHNGTTAMFARHGFRPVTQLGRHRWLMTCEVPADV